MQEKFMTKPKTISTIFIFLIWLVCYAEIAAAVDTVSITPDSRVVFNQASDKKTLFIKVSPAEAGVEIIVDVDTSVVEVSSDILTTDSQGKAKLTIKPGETQNTTLLTVIADGVESNVIVVENNAICNRTPPRIIPDELRIDFDQNPNSSATISAQCAKNSNVTIHNQNPDIVTTPSVLSTDSDGNAELTIIAHQSGEATITASLPNATMSNPLHIKVVTCAGMTTTPTQTQLTTEESTIFYVKGNCGTYTWSAEDGTLENHSGEEVNYTAPNYPGDFDVVVRDRKGNKAIIKVHVIEALKLYPTEACLRAGEKIKMQARGGQPPYQFNILNGSATIDNVETNSAWITAPASKGDSTVLVRDSAGNEAETILNMGDGMLLSSKEIEITEENNSNTISIQQGCAPFLANVEKGNVELIGREIKIDPPVENGSYHLIVKDATGAIQEAVVNVKIPGRLQITPSKTRIELGDTVTFEAVGGKAPYTFINSGGNLSCNECKSTNLSVDNTDFDLELHVTDNTGAKATAIIEIDQPINVATVDGQQKRSKFITMYPGESKRFKISGGSGNYSYNTNLQVANIITETSNGDIILTAPPRIDKNFSMTIEDSRGGTVTISFEIQPTTLGITPSIVSLDLGDSKNQTFEIISDYNDFKIWAEKGTIISHKGKSILYRPPSIAGSDFLYVQSKSGDKTVATIDIAKSLSISPEIIYIKNKPDVSKVIHVSGGYGNYVFQAKYGDLNPPFAKASETGVDVTYTPPGVMMPDEIISVSDSKAKQDSTPVIISNLLRITPKMVTLAPGEQVDISGINGVAPYDATVTSGSLNKINSQTNKVVYSYTASAEVGKYKIRIIDAADNVATGEIFVTSSLKITPTTKILRPGESGTIKIIGGSKPYVFTTELGDLLNSDINDDVISYRAPLSFEGEEIDDYIKIYDSQEKYISAHIKVVKTPKSIISCNAKNFRVDDNLKINLSLLGTGNVDVYVAVKLPDDLGILFLTQNPEAQFVAQATPYLLNSSLINETKYENVLSLDNIPQLPPGKYTLYSRAVPHNTLEATSFESVFSGEFSSFTVDIQ
jgi:plastocyanin